MDSSSYPDEGDRPSAEIIPFRRPSPSSPSPEPAPHEDDGDDDGPTAA